MDCELIQIDLVSYHFGVIEQDARLLVEQHLAQCSRCLQDFIALKRAIETAPDARPSPMAKARLRKAVMQEVSPRHARVVWSWWERPLAAAFASAAVFAAIVTVHAVGTSQGAAPRGWVASSGTNSSSP